MLYPELKSEYVFMFSKKISNYHTFFVRIENEKITNFNFENNNISLSNTAWVGYSFLIK